MNHAHDGRAACCFHETRAMVGIPLGVRILGPLVLCGAVVNNPMAEVVPGSRCAFSHSGPLDRTSLVSPAREPSDYAGYCVVSGETISLTWRLGLAVRLDYINERTMPRNFPTCSLTSFSYNPDAVPDSGQTRGLRRGRSR